MCAHRYRAMAVFNATGTASSMTIGSLNSSCTRSRTARGALPGMYGVFEPAWGVSVVVEGVSKQELIEHMEECGSGRDGRPACIVRVMHHRHRVALIRCAVYLELVVEVGIFGCGPCLWVLRKVTLERGTVALSNPVEHA